MAMVGKIGVPKKSVSLILILLLLVIPFYSSFVVARADFGQGIIIEKDSDEVFDTLPTGLVAVGPNDALDVGNENSQDDSISDVPDVGGKCAEKGEDVNAIVAAMDNEVIATLEKVVSVMYLICTTMTAINSVLNSLYMGLACCAPNLINGMVCETQEVELKAWSLPYTTVIKPLCCLVQCGWCSGEEGGECFGVIGEVLSAGALLDNIPGVLNVPQKGGGTEKAGAGIAQFHVSPYENIYVAVGCMCPGAIMFNLRKLKTIYQTYDCCVEQACENGFSTDSCETQLSEATCMYWKGSLMKTLTKVLFGFLSSIISEKLAEIFGQVALGSTLHCALAIWDIANTPATISGVKEAWEWTTATFKEPTCEDLGFKDIKEESEMGNGEDDDEGGFGSAESGTNRLTLHDGDGDGVYDGVAKNYEYERVSGDDLKKLVWTYGGINFDGEEKYSSVYKYTTSNADGENVVYYKVRDGVFGKSKILDADGVGVTDFGTDDDKKEMTFNDVLAASTPVGIEGNTYNTIFIDGENRAYRVGEGGLEIEDYNTEDRLTYAELAGQDFELAGVNLKGSEWDDVNNGFVWKEGETRIRTMFVFDQGEEGYNAFNIEDINEGLSNILQFSDGERMTIKKTKEGHAVMVGDDSFEIEGNLPINMGTLRDSLKIANGKSSLSEAEKVEFVDIKAGGEVIGNKLSWGTEGQENSVETIEEGLDKKIIYRVVENGKVSYAKETTDGEIINLLYLGTLPDTPNLMNDFAAREALGEEFWDYEKKLVTPEDGMVDRGAESYYQYELKDDDDEIKVKLNVYNNGDTILDKYNEQGEVIEHILTTDKKIVSGSFEYDNNEKFAGSNTEIKNRETGLIESRLIMDGKKRTDIAYEGDEITLTIDNENEYIYDSEKEKFLKKSKTSPNVVKSEESEEIVHYVFEGGRMIIMEDGAWKIGDDTYVYNSQENLIVKEGTMETLDNQATYEEVILTGSESDPNAERLLESKGVIEKDTRANEKTEQKGTTPEARAIYERNKKDWQAQAIYQATWSLLDATLGEFAYGAIDGMCKEDEPEDRAAEGDGESSE